MNINVKLEPQQAVAARHIELLTGSPDTMMCFRYLPEDPITKARVLAHEKAERVKTGNRKFCIRRNYDGTLAEQWPNIVKHQEHGWAIYFVVNEGGRNATSITRIRALFADGDGVALPAWEDWHARPSFGTLRDETHWHAYWLVNDCPLNEFATMQKRIAAFYKSDPDVHDLPRVLRLAGTLHQKHKDGEPSRLIKLECGTW